MAKENLYRPSHKELVERAFKWLKNTKKCGVVMTEWYGGTRETPDAIGFWAGKSILVECKISRSDFLGDKNKYFRKRPGYGMGDERYYLAPPGIIEIEDVPKNWGLLIAHKKKIIVAKKAEVFKRKISGIINERKILINAMRAVICETGKEADWFKLSESIKRGEKDV